MKINITSGGPACLLAMILSAAPVLAETKAENAALATALKTITTPELKTFVETLADDSLEGREAGSRGGRAAGAYLEKEFQKLKLKPLGDNKTYFQSFEGSSRNILGLMEGGDPALKDQVIVFGAHYDHVGYGSATNSYGPIGKIHNGADDNASGVAGLLEVAGALRALPESPRRPILFAFWDGEEKGLNGSRHWLNNATVPVKNIVFSINTDMIGRLRDQGLEVIGSRSMPRLRQRICEINRGYQVPLDFTWSMKQDSDHWPFFARDIPVVMFHTGLHNEYHSPRDDANLLNYDGMRQTSQIMVEFLVAVANDDETPRFRDAAKKEGDGNRAAIEAISTAPPPRFGLSWMQDPKTMQIRVSSVNRDSPAFRCGLRAGDEIVEFNGSPIVDERTLRLEILYAPTPVRLKVRREGNAEPIEMTAEPKGSPVRVGLSWREDDAEPGVIILSYVVPHSAAAMAGLKTGDRIDRIDGRPIANSDDFLERCRDAQTELKFRRERKGLLTDVTLVLLPPRENAE